MDWFDIGGWISFIGMIAIPALIFFLGNDSENARRKEMKRRGIDPSQQKANSNVYLATRDPRGADMGGIE